MIITTYMCDRVDCAETALHEVPRTDRSITFPDGWGWDNHDGEVEFHCPQHRNQPSEATLAEAQRNRIEKTGLLIQLIDPPHVILVAEGETTVSQ